MPPSYLVDRIIPSTNNHFVTLRKPVKVLQPGDHYFKAHLPTLIGAAMPVHPKVPPKVSTKVSSPSSTQVTTVHLLKSRRLVQTENKLA